MEAAVPRYGGDVGCMLRWLVVAMLLVLPWQVALAAPDAPGGEAVIHIYRPRSIAGMGASFDVYAGERLVCHLREEECCTARVAPGEVEIWSRFLSKGAVTLDVEAGREYYVRGSVTKGLLILWRPHYVEVDQRIWKSETQACKREGESLSQ